MVKLYKLAIVMTFLFSLVFSNELSKEEKLEKINSMSEPIKPYQPEIGYVPNEKVAIEIAQAVLKPLLKNEYKKELPLRATKKDDKWIVQGKKRKKCGPKKKDCFQLDNSPVYLEINADSGQIITFSRYQ